MTELCCKLPEPIIKEIDVRTAAVATNNNFSIRLVTLEASFRLHECHKCSCDTRDIEALEEMKRHDDWYEHVAENARKAVKELLRAGTIEVARESWFRPGSGQRPTTYRYVEEDR